jgi:hypothetical protein
MIRCSSARRGIGAQIVSRPPTRNNQRRGVHWARDYEFAARIQSFGAVAQLGERLAGSQKATGSSPVGSILGV